MWQRLQHRVTGNPKVSCRCNPHGNALTQSVKCERLSLSELRETFKGLQQSNACWSEKKEAWLSRESARSFLLPWATSLGSDIVEAAATLVPSADSAPDTRGSRADLTCKLLWALIPASLGATLRTDSRYVCVSLDLELRQAKQHIVQRAVRQPHNLGCLGWLRIQETT